jgi:drug/metabolite transporter (DMT)-like permease
VNGYGVGRLLALRRSPLWLVGAALQAASFAVQAVALALAPLALVQPTAATDLLFALPFLALTQRRRLRSRKWAAALLVATGVAVFLAVSLPRPGTPTADPHEWTTAVAAVATVAAAALTGSRWLTGTGRTSLLCGCRRC